MRFAWLRQQMTDSTPPSESLLSKGLLVAYNLVFWVPLVLGFAGFISHQAGFIGFFVIILFRAATNLYRNNVLPWDKAELFPLRIP